VGEEKEEEEVFIFNLHILVMNEDLLRNPPAVPYSSFKTINNRYL
jgi:hypothetical protein